MSSKEQQTHPLDAIKVSLHPPVKEDKHDDPAPAPSSSANTSSARHPRNFFSPLPSTYNNHPDTEPPLFCAKRTFNEDGGSTARRCSRKTSPTHIGARRDSNFPHQRETYPWWRHNRNRELLTISPVLYGHNFNA